MCNHLSYIVDLRMEVEGGTLGAMFSHFAFGGKNEGKELRVVIGVVFFSFHFFVF